MRKQWNILYVLLIFSVPYLYNWSRDISISTKIYEVIFVYIGKKVKDLY